MFPRNILKVIASTQVVHMIPKFNCLVHYTLNMKLLKSGMKNPVGITTRVCGWFQHNVQELASLCFIKSFIRSSKLGFEFLNNPNLNFFSLYFHFSNSINTEMETNPVNPLRDKNHTVWC